MDHSIQYRMYSIDGVRCGPRETCITRGHNGATWQIRLNDPCSAMVRPYVKLRRMLRKTLGIATILLQWVALSVAETKLGLGL